MEVETSEKPSAILGPIRCCRRVFLSFFPLSSLHSHHPSSLPCTPLIAQLAGIEARIQRTPYHAWFCQPAVRKPRCPKSKGSTFRANQYYLNTGEFGAVSIFVRIGRSLVDILHETTRM